MLDRTRTRYWHLGLAILLRSTTPRWFRLVLARVLGSAGFRILKRLREAVTDNLQIVTGSRRQAVLLARRTFVNYCIYLADYMLFPFLKKESVERLLPEVRGGENVKNALARGRGVILVTPHLGNWELGGLWLSGRNYPLNVVSLSDEDPRTEAFRNDLRKRHGIRLLRYDPRSSSMASMVGILDALKRNELVAMLTDRPAAERCEEVPFFGRTARFPIGAFVLSWISEAPVIPCLCPLAPDGTYSLVTDRPIELDRARDRAESLRHAIVEMARRYEGFIRSHPDQWYNFYPYWNETR